MKYFGANQEMNVSCSDKQGWWMCEKEVWTCCCDSLKLLCCQEIHNLQSKKTDVGELEKEREEAMQRLQVSWLLAEYVVYLFCKTFTGLTHHVGVNSQNYFALLYMYTCVTGKWHIPHTGLMCKECILVQSDMSIYCILGALTLNTNYK